MSTSTFIKTLVAAGLISAGMTGVAFARDQVFTARLVAPVSAQTEIIADSTLWRCEVDSCQTVARHAASVRACRQFVREAGAVAAYGPEGDMLTEEELERCNRAARTTTLQAQNQ